MVALVSTDRTGGRQPGALTLSEDDRRVLAEWAADCVERALPLFSASAPGDERPKKAIEGTRAFARGGLQIGAARALAFDAHAAAREAACPAATAVARAAGQAVAVAHMGSHALGVAYAAVAAARSRPHDPRAAMAELTWQIDHASPEVRAAIRKLPIRDNGRGLLGQLVQKLQSSLASDTTNRDSAFTPPPVRRDDPFERPGRAAL